MIRKHPYPFGIAVVKSPCGMDAQASTRGEAAPPTLIGGVNSQKMDFKGLSRTLGIDWIQGTVPQHKLAGLYDYLCEMCGCEPELFDRGFLGYQRSAVWHPFGIALAWDTTEKNLGIHSFKALLQLKGEACGCFSADSLHQFCGDLCWKFWFKCSRVDLCFDDYERIKTPSEVYRECCCGEEKKYSGFRRHRYIVEEKSNGEKSGDTLYFGTRGKNGGGKLMRCYDKNLESKGEIDSIRWEVEFSKDRASELFYRIAISGSLEEFVTRIAAFIGGAMDFIERNGKNLDRAHRMAFWERILAILGSSSIRNPRPLKTIEKAQEWIERAVAPSLGMLRKAFGNMHYFEWIEQMVQDTQLTKYQINVVHDYQRRKDACNISI